MAGCVGSFPGSTDEQTADSPDDTWRMRSYDSGNSGNAPLATPPREEAIETWTGPMLGGNLPNAPATDGELVYAGSDEYIYSFDINDGELEWVTTFDGLTYAIAPVIDDESLYVGEMLTEQERRGVANLASMESTSGIVDWKLENHITSSPTLVEETLYFSNQPDDDIGYVAAVDGDAGQLIWEAPLASEGETRLSTEPAVVGDIVVVTGHIRIDEGWQGRTVAFDRDDGSHLWTVDVQRPVSASPVANDETVYVGQIDGTVSALEVSTGDQQWKTNIEPIDYLHEPPALDSDRLYVIGYHQIASVDVESGDVSWHRHLGDGKRSFVVTANDAVYITRDRILALDQEDGNELWSIEKEGFLVSFGSPSIAGGKLFTSSCIKEEPMDYYDINTHCIS